MSAWTKWEDFGPDLSSYFERFQKPFFNFFTYLGPIAWLLSLYHPDFLGNTTSGLTVVIVLCLVSGFSVYRDMRSQYPKGLTMRTVFVGFSEGNEYSLRISPDDSSKNPEITLRVNLVIENSMKNELRVPKMTISLAGDKAGRIWAYVPRMKPDRTSLDREGTTIAPHSEAHFYYESTVKGSPNLKTLTQGLKGKPLALLATLLVDLEVHDPKDIHLKQTLSVKRTLRISLRPLRQCYAVLWKEIGENKLLRDIGRAPINPVSKPSPGDF